MQPACRVQHLALPEEARSAPVLVAFSGGLDSTTLLHLLAHDASLRARGLRALHVHHGLHPQADRWAAHCRDICAAWDIPLRVLRVEVERNGGHGLEAAARDARHEAFRQALSPGEVLATAHHQDDQAETFLLRALRASGPDGLAAMRPWRSFAPGWHWRPLLKTPHTALLAHARHHGLHWIDDPSNANAEHDRNFLRHRVLPLLRERWPHAAAAFARSAELSSEATDLLIEGDLESLASVRSTEPQLLSITALMQLPASRRARVLRRWVNEISLPALPAEGVRRIETELLTARHDAEAEFEWDGVVVRRWRDLLHASPRSPAWPPQWRTPWDGRSPLSLPVGGSLSLEGAAPLPEPAVVHARQGGERIILPGRAHRHELKKVLQDHGIPAWMRERMPLLSTMDGELMAAGDRILSARFDAWLKQQDARLVWRTDGLPAP